MTLETFELAMRIAVEIGLLIVILRFIVKS